MSPTKYLLRSFSGVALGSIATLVVFGLFLSLLWAVFPATSSSKSIGALISAALALSVGGFVLAWTSGGTNWVRPGVFGLLFGGISFTYIFGPVWNALILAGASAQFAAFGAFIFKLFVMNRSTHGGRI